MCFSIGSPLEGAWCPGCGVLLAQVAGDEVHYGLNPSTDLARSSVSDEHIYSGGVWVSQSCAERTLELSEIM